MSYLFQITKNVVYPNAETLLISPFKEIWERDKTKDKNIAVKEFSFIEFTTSQLKSNPYKEYPAGRREDKIITDLFKDVSWTPDKLIKEAQEKIIEFQEEGSLSYTYHKAAVAAAEKTKNFFENFSYSKLNFKSGAPLYKPAEITRALKDTNSTLKELKELKKKVEEELFEEVKTRAEKKISIFAKPESLKIN